MSAGNGLLGGQGCRPFQFRLNTDVWRKFHLANVPLSWPSPLTSGQRLTMLATEIFSKGGNNDDSR